MSKLNFNRKVFLSKEELTQEQAFRSNKSLAELLLLSLTKSWGIISANPGESSTELRVFQGDSPGTIKLSAGNILTSAGKIISFSGKDQFSVQNNGVPYYVCLIHRDIHYEDCIVSINTDGTLNTEDKNYDFNTVLRGQGSLAPVMVRFVPASNPDSTAQNNGYYEVVEVNSSNLALLNAKSGMVKETNLRMIVLGTLPIGEVFSEEQKAGLYSYDGYDYTQVLLDQSAYDAISGMRDEGLAFALAKVTNNSGVVSIEEENTLRKYWSIRGE